MPANVKKDLRKLDEMPKWKQREITRLKERDDRLAQEQDERDFKNKRGKYHPEAIALAQQQAALEAARRASQQPAIRDSIIDHQTFVNNQQVGSTLTDSRIDHMQYVWGQEQSLPSPQEDLALRHPDVYLPDVTTTEFWKSKTFKELINKAKAIKIDPKGIASPVTSQERIIQEFQSRLGKLGSGIVPPAPGRPYTPYTAGASVRNPLKQLSPIGIDLTGLENRPMVPSYQLPVQPPKFLVTKDGQPFRTDQSSLYEIMKENNKNETGFWKRDVEPVLFGALGWLEETLYGGVGEKGLTWGGMSEEEWVYQEDPSPVQAIVQFTFNVGLLGMEAIRALWSPAKEEFSLSDLNPETAMTVAERKLAQQQARDQSAERLGEAWDSTVRAWSGIVEAFKQDSADIIKTYEEKSGMSREEQEAYYSQRAEQVKVERENSAARSKMMAFDAFNLYKSGLRSTDPTSQTEMFNQALEMQKASIEERRRSDPLDPFGAASWQREPERYEKFIENAAFLELQLGRPLSIAEVRRLKDMYANFWTEFGFQMVFDVTNILPVVGTVAQLGFQSVSSIPLVAKATKAVTTTLDPIQASIRSAPVIRWFTQKSVGATANLMTQNMNDVVMRMLPSYGTVAEMIEDLNRLEGITLMVKSAPDEEAARAAYEAGIKQIGGGLEQLSYPDVKRLADMDINLQGWGNTMSESLQEVRDALTDQFTRKYRNKSADEIEQMVEKHILDRRYAGQPVVSFAGKFGASYVDNHRIFEKSIFTDDTISGTIAKWAAEYTSSLPEAASKKVRREVMNSWIDKFMVRAGIGAGDTWKRLLRATLVDGLEAAIRWGRVVREMWTAVVLTSPRWVFSNLMDSMGRSVIYGGNVWDDIGTLLVSNQSHFMDETGFIPMAMGTSLARAVDFMDSVPVKLLYGEDKPRWGLLSYWKQEHERLIKNIAEERMSPNLTGLSEEVAKAITSKMAGKQASVFQKTWDFVRTLPAAAAGGIADFNTAIEFTLRTRMFHREYFRILSILEPQFMTRRMENLNPATQQIAMQIWKEAQGNPAKITSLVASITDAGKTTNKNKTWSFILPESWMKDTRMSPSEAQTFTLHARTPVEDFIAKTVQRTGEYPTPAEFNKFMDEMESGLQDAVQNTLSQSFQYKNLDGSINPKKTPVKEANFDDMKGAHPDYASKTIPVSEAIGRLERKVFKRFDPEDVATSYVSAMRGMTDIVGVEGDSLVVKMVNKRPVLEIGDQVWKKSKSEVYAAMNEATSKYIALVNEEFLAQYGIQPYALQEMVREFMSDPAAVLSKSEDAFLAIVETLHTTPRLKELLQVTSNKPLAAYDSLYRYYAEHSQSSLKYLMGDESAFKQYAQKLNDETLMPLFERRKWAQEHMKEAARLTKMTESLDPTVASKVNEFQNLRDIVHTEFRQFTRLVFPGPGFRKGGERKVAWEAWELILADAYRVESELSRELSELLSKNADEALSYMDNLSASYNEEFLRRVGFEVVWTDESKSQFLRVIRNIDGKSHVYYPGDYVADGIKAYFFPSANSTRSAVYKASANPSIDMRKKLSYILTDTFGVSHEQGLAWTRMMENHAARWAQDTGRTVQEYFDRFQFKYDSTLGNSYVERAADGTITFYAHAKKDLPSLFKASATVFVEDLREMSKYNDEARHALDLLTAYISKGEDADKVFTDVFMQYLDSGRVPNAKLYPVFRRLRNWMTEEFKILRSMPDVEELPEEVFQALNRMYMQSITDPERIQAQYLRDIATAMGVDPDELLKTANEAVNVTAETVRPLEIPGDLEPLLDNIADAVVRAKELGKTESLEKMDTLWKYIEEVEKTGVQTEEERWLLLLAKQSLMDEADNVRQIGRNSEVFGTPEWKFVEGENLRRKSYAYHVLKNVGVSDVDISRMTRTELFTRAIEAMEQLETINRPSLANISRWIKENFTSGINNWRSAERLSVEEIEQAAMRMASEVTDEVSTFAKSREYMKAWDTWKQNRTISRFPEEVLETPEKFSSYLRFKIDHEAPDISAAYERILYDVQNFQARVLSLKRTIPHIPEFQMSSGMRTWIRHNVHNVSNYDEALRHLRELRKHLVDGNYRMPILSAESAEDLKKWAETARTAKADLVNLVLNGGEHNGRKIQGAIDRVNKIMLDYGDQSRYDVFMKNFFPFWMFPSRSVPFWMKTIATHPELIAFYNKMQRLSNAARVQEGAVTSDGKPIDRLDGYIPIPGTDMWINPIGPMSFKYVLGLPDLAEDMRYKVQAEQELNEDDPMTFATKQVLEYGPLMGFNVAPWVAWGLKMTTGVSDDVLPQFPVAPEFSLFPRWQVFDLIKKTTGLSLSNTPFGNFLYPEAGFQAALVEQRILQNALEKMNQPGASKAAIAEAARQAMLEREGNPLWDETYKEVQQDQTEANRWSFFTGFYPKEFTDGQADLYALRNQLNIMKSAMNNEMQARIFNLDPDAEARWNDYLEMQDLPESEVYRLYVSSGWVRDENNKLVTDPVERVKYLRAAITNEQNQMAYFAGLQEARKALDEALRDLPIGADYTTISGAYDTYFNEISTLRDSFPFTLERGFGSSKPASLIEKELRDDYYIMLLSTRPRFDPTVKYEEYQQRLQDWEERLPYMAPYLLRSFQGRSDVSTILSSLRPDQQLSPMFLKSLVDGSTPSEIKRWQRERDDVFDALNEAWSELYWRPYWETMGNLSGYERELAEQDFSATRKPPDANELYQWIQKEYGNRFTYNEIYKWVNGTEVLEIEKRLLAQQTAEEQARSKVWDLVSWLGPSKDMEMLEYLEKYLEVKGFKGDIISDMLERNKFLFNGQPEELEKLVVALEDVYRERNVQPPTRDQLVQYVMAQDSNEQFKEIINQEMSRYAPPRLGAYDTIQYWQGEYYAVNSTDWKRKFRKNNPAEYAMLQEYWNRKRAYGRTDPVWNMYYNMNPATGNVPEQFKGIFDLESGRDYQYPGTIPVQNFSPSGTGGTRRRLPGSDEPVGMTPLRPRTSSGQSSSSFYVPSGLRKTIGTMLMREVNKLMYDGQKLSASAVQFLSSLAQRHPEWADEIQNILSQNETP
jgi:hypothetical protein